jgi:hypothetical protein
VAVDSKVAISTDPQLIIDDSTTINCKVKRMNTITWRVHFIIPFYIVYPLHVISTLMWRRRKWRAWAVAALFDVPSIGRLSSAAQGASCQLSLHCSPNIPAQCTDDVLWRHHPILELYELLRCKCFGQLVRNHFIGGTIFDCYCRVEVIVDKVCGLCKAFYRLKPASRVW